MMYPSPRQFLLAAPQSLDQAQTWEVFLWPTWLSALDETGQLLPGPLSAHGKGGLMLVRCPPLLLDNADPPGEVGHSYRLPGARLRRRHSGPGAAAHPVPLQLICGLEEGLTSERTFSHPGSWKLQRPGVPSIHPPPSPEVLCGLTVGGGHRHLRPPPAGFLCLQRAGISLSPLRQGAGPGPSPRKP